MLEIYLSFVELVYQWEGMIIFVAGVVISLILWFLDWKILSKKIRFVLIITVLLSSIVLSMFVDYVKKEYAYLPEINYNSYSYTYVEQMLINKGFVVNEPQFDAVAEERISQGEEPTSYYFKVTHMEPEPGTFVNKGSSIVLNITWFDYYEEASLNNGGNSSEDTTPSIKPDDAEFDIEQIEYIINEAEVLAVKEDYEAAVMKIQAGLAVYPKSAELQNKANEYTEALKIKIKNETLLEANVLADSGDYVAAIILIKDAQTTQGDNVEYQNALKLYSSGYKTEIIVSADTLAANGDYVSAIAAINEAKTVVGNDAELINKEQLYEDEYVDNVVKQVDLYIKENNYDTAINYVTEVLQIFPKNKILIERSSALKNCKPQSLLSICPPYIKEGYYTEKTYSMTGNIYSNGFHLNDEHGGVAYFNLNQEYSMLNFEIGHIDGKKIKTGYYYIFLDGELTQTLRLNPTELVQNVEISVEGVSRLMIMGGPWCHCFAVVNATLTPNILSERGVTNQSNTNTGKYVLDVCPPYHKEGYFTEKFYSLADNAYIKGFHLNDNSGGIAYYNLNGKYTTLSFDVGHIDGSKLNTGYYYFYLDSDLVYTLELNPSMLVQHIEIPLNGALQMVIEGGPWCHCFALVNVKVSE